ncbi:MAG: MarR family transcriptional regulator [Tissierellia bacterium]|nr:MarR family transcriptional regulator [Tissierellia bacterium]
MNKIELSILIALHRNVNLIDKKTMKLVGDNSLTLSQFMVLEALYSKGDMSIGQVMEKILSSVGTISLIVDNLVKLNLITKTANPKDRRIKILSLTDKGYDLINRVAPMNEQLIIESMDKLSLSEKRELLTLLKKLYYSASDDESIG